MSTLIEWLTRKASGGTARRAQWRNGIGWGAADDDETHGACIKLSRRLSTPAVR
jgi:hypothetical protein